MKQTFVKIGKQNSLFLDLSLITVTKLYKKSCLKLQKGFVSSILNSVEANNSSLFEFKKNSELACELLTYAKDLITINIQHEIQLEEFIKASLIYLIESDYLFDTQLCIAPLIFLFFMTSSHSTKFDAKGFRCASICMKECFSIFKEHKLTNPKWIISLFLYCTATSCDSATIKHIIDIVQEHNTRFAEKNLDYQECTALLFCFGNTLREFNLFNKSSLPLFSETFVIGMSVEDSVSENEAIIKIVSSIKSFDKPSTPESLNIIIKKLNETVINQISLIGDESLYETCLKFSDSRLKVALARIDAKKEIRQKKLQEEKEESVVLTDF